MLKTLQNFFSMNLFKLIPFVVAIGLPGLALSNAEVEAAPKGATRFSIDNKNNNKYYVQPQDYRYSYVWVHPTYKFSGRASSRVNVNETMIFHIYDKYGANKPVSRIVISKLPEKRGEPKSADNVFNDGEGELKLEVTLKLVVDTSHLYQYKFEYKYQ